MSRTKRATVTIYALVAITPIFWYGFYTFIVIMIGHDYLPAAVLCGISGGIALIKLLDEIDKEDK